MLVREHKMYSSIGLHNYEIAYYKQACFMAYYHLYGKNIVQIQGYSK